MVIIKKKEDDHENILRKKCTAPDTFLLMKWVVQCSGLEKAVKINFMLKNQAA